MTMQALIQRENPFQPILDEIARHGENIAPIPVASAMENGQWTVDVEVRFRLRKQFDCSAAAATLDEAIRKALHFVKRELPK